jgi:phage-related protein
MNRRIRSSLTAGDMLELVELATGEAFVVCALKRTGHEASFVFRYLAAMREADREQWAKLVQRIRRLSDHGPMIANDQKSRALQGTDLFELKEGPTRIIWFYDRLQRRRIVMTHAFTKRRQKTPPQEVSRARGLQSEYYHSRT